MNHRCTACLKTYDETLRYFRCDNKDSSEHKEAVEKIKGTRFSDNSFKKKFAKSIKITNADWTKIWDKPENGVFLAFDSSDHARCPACKNENVRQRACPHCYHDVDLQEKVHLVTVAGNNVQEVNCFLAGMLHKALNCFQAINGLDWHVTVNETAQEVYRKFVEGHVNIDGGNPIAITFNKNCRKYTLIFRPICNNTGENGTQTINDSDLLDAIDEGQLIYLVKEEEFNPGQDVFKTPETSMANFIDNHLARIVRLYNKQKIKQINYVIISEKNNFGNFQNCDATDYYKIIFDEINNISEKDSKKLFEEMGKLAIKNILKSGAEKSNVFFVPNPKNAEEAKKMYDLMTPFMAVARDLIGEVFGQDQE